MAVIDAHAHIYPEKIASKAVDAVGAFYGVEMFDGGACSPGTPEALLACTNESPITHFIVHSVATTSHAVTSINDFIADQARRHPEFIGFGTMHPDFEDKEAEVNRVIELGLHGFKIHPDTQMVDTDDPRLMEFYEIIAGRWARMDSNHGRQSQRVYSPSPLTTRANSQSFKYSQVLWSFGPPPPRTKKIIRCHLGGCQRKPLDTRCRAYLYSCDLRFC